MIDYKDLAAKVRACGVGENHRQHLASQLADALRIVDGTFIPKDFIEAATGRPSYYHPMNLDHLSDKHWR